ncbi:hypothetical protein MP228_010752 [Amoeboaphelidium protococcarum]|nr:hypothetical protein MP228_010752 [Amoeboaphelidium protococcarum]
MLASNANKIHKSILKDQGGNALAKLQIKSVKDITKPYNANAQHDVTDDKEDDNAQKSGNAKAKNPLYMLVLSDGKQEIKAAELERCRLLSNNDLKQGQFITIQNGYMQNGILLLTNASIKSITDR